MCFSLVCFCLVRPLLLLLLKSIADASEALFRTHFRRLSPRAPIYIEIPMQLTNQLSLLGHQIMATQGFFGVRVPDNSVEALAKLTAARKDELVKKCVHALIVLGQDRQPIKKEDLGRLVFHSVGNFRVVNGIIAMANEELQDTFGMELYMYQDKSQPKFFLVNTSLSDNQYHVPLTDDENEELVLLEFALMQIFLSQDFRSTFEDIEKGLKPFELKDRGTDYLKNIIDRMVRLMYLSTMKHQDATLYMWGPRAYAEHNLDKFFDRFLNLAKETNLEAWPDLVERLKKMKKSQEILHAQ